MSSFPHSVAAWAINGVLHQQEEEYTKQTDKMLLICDRVDASKQVYHKVPLWPGGGATFVLHLSQDEELRVLAHYSHASGEEREQQVRILGVGAVTCFPISLMKTTSGWWL